MMSQGYSLNNESFMNQDIKIGRQKYILSKDKAK